MFKRKASTHRKLISKSGYLFALAIPFISFSGDTKASTKLTSANKLLLTSKQVDNFKFNKLINQKNKLNIKSENFLIAEDTFNDYEKLYVKTCTKKDPESGGSEEENQYWNKCSIQEAEKSEKARELMKSGNQSLSESCFQGICTTLQIGTKEQLGLGRDFNSKDKTPFVEDSFNGSKKIYMKTCTKKDPESGGSEEENQYWNKCSLEEAEKSEKGRELMKSGNQSLSESCFQGICTTVQIGTKEQLGEVEKIEGSEAVAEDDQVPRVLISEVIIEGLEDHPEKERLELIAYDAMLTRPGSKITSEELKKDLNRIFVTGWFTPATRAKAVEGPLGTQLIVRLYPNPIFKKIKLLPVERKLSNSKLNEIFNNDFGKTLNLNTLKIRIKEIKDWYNSNGYSLARISGPNRLTKDGIVQLDVKEGYISGIEISFIDEDGNTRDKKGRLKKGKIIWCLRWIFTGSIIYSCI